MYVYPDSKVHGANMGPIWGRQDPGGPHELCYLGRFSRNISIPSLQSSGATFCHESRSSLICRSGPFLINLDDTELITATCHHTPSAWTNAGILLNGPLGTNSSEILIEIYISSVTIIHLSVKLVALRKQALHGYCQSRPRAGNQLLMFAQQAVSQPSDFTGTKGTTT